MEVKASGTLDLEGIRALIHLSMFKKNDPKKGIIIIALVFSVLIVLNIAAICVYYSPIFFVTMYLLLLLAFINCYKYFIFPKKSYKNLSKMQGTVNEYVFCDSVLKISTKNREHNGEAEYEYSVFVKAYETSRYLFLYQSNNTAFVVDLSTVSGGTVLDIRNKLSSFLHEKYIICNY